MWYGWIDFVNQDIGIKIILECHIHIKQQHPDGSYYCEIKDEDFDKLDKHWGNAIWGLNYCE